MRETERSKDTEDVGREILVELCRRGPGEILGRQLYHFILGLSR